MTYFQFAPYEVDPAGLATLDGANLQWFWCYRFIGADAETAAAGVAKLLERQHTLFNADDGAVLADLPALTTDRTFFRIDLRDVYRNLSAYGNLRPQKNVAVRFLNVAIEILNFSP